MSQFPQYLTSDLAEVVKEEWLLGSIASIVRNAILDTVDVNIDHLIDILSSESSNSPVLGLIKLVLKEEPGLAIPAILGFIASIFVPISILFFWCFGYGKYDMRDLRRHTGCWKWVNGLILLLLATILFAMSSCVLESGNRLRQSTRLILTSFKYSVKDISTYTSHITQDGEYKLEHTVSSKVDEVQVHATDLPNTMAQMLKDNVASHLSVIDEVTTQLLQDQQHLQDYNKDVEALVNHIINEFTTFESHINEVHSELKALVAQCAKDAESFCDNVVSSHLKPVIVDTHQLLEISTLVHTFLQTVESYNISKYSALRSIFDTLPDSLGNATDIITQEAVMILSVIPTRLKSKFDEHMDMFNTTTRTLIVHEMDRYEATIRTALDQIAFQYISLLSLALAGILLAVAMLTILGLILGCVCTRKKSGSSYHILTGNRRAFNYCRTHCLMLPVVVGFLFLTYVLLLSSFLLIIGGNLSLLCPSLQDLTLLNKVFDADSIQSHNPSPGEPLEDPLGHFFKTCKNDGTLYSALQLEQRLNLTSILSFLKFEFDPDLTATYHSALQTLKLFDPWNLVSLKSTLDVSTQNTSNIISQVRTNFSDWEVYLEGLQEAFTTADSAAEETNSTIIMYQLTKVKDLTSRNGPYLLSKLSELEVKMEKFPDLRQKVKTSFQSGTPALVEALENVQNFITNDAEAIIVEKMTDFLDTVRELPAIMYDDVIEQLETNVCKCQVITYFYDTITASMCVHFLDSVNVLWTALYTGGVVTIFLMVASCTMMKYFGYPSSKPHMIKSIPTDKNRYAAINTTSPAVVIKMSSVQTDLSAQHSQDNQNNNNSSRLNRSYFRLPIVSSSILHVARQKMQQQRRKFATGSGTPELLRIKNLQQSLRATCQPSMLSSAGEPWAVQCVSLKEMDSVDELCKSLHAPVNVGLTDSGAETNAVNEPSTEFSCEHGSNPEIIREVASCFDNVHLSNCEEGSHRIFEDDTHTKANLEETRVFDKDISNLKHQNYEKLNLKKYTLAAKSPKILEHTGNLSNNSLWLEKEDSCLHTITHFSRKQDRQAVAKKSYLTDYAFKHDNQRKPDTIEPFARSNYQTSTGKAIYNYSSNLDDPNTDLPSETNLNRTNFINVDIHEEMMENDMKNTRITASNLSLDKAKGRKMIPKVAQTKSDLTEVSKQLQYQDSESFHQYLNYVDEKQPSNITCALCRSKVSSSICQERNPESTQSDNLYRREIIGNAHNDERLSAKDINCNNRIKTMKQNEPKAFTQLTNAFDRHLTSSEKTFEDNFNKDRNSTPLSSRKESAEQQHAFDLTATNKLQNEKRRSVDELGKPYSKKLRSSNTYKILDIEIRPYPAGESMQQVSTSPSMALNSEADMFTEEHECRKIPANSVFSQEQEVAGLKNPATATGPPALAEIAMRTYTQMFIPSKHKHNYVQSRGRNPGYRLQYHYRTNQQGSMSQYTPLSILNTNSVRKPPSSIPVMLGSASTAKSTTQMTYL